jgi:hypothetical protein
MVEGRRHTSALLSPRNAGKRDAKHEHRREQQKQACACPKHASFTPPC